MLWLSWKYAEYSPLCSESRDVPTAAAHIPAMPSAYRTRHRRVRQGLLPIQVIAQYEIAGISDRDVGSELEGDVRQGFQRGDSRPVESQEQDAAEQP